MNWVLLAVGLLGCSRGPAGQTLDDVARGRCEGLPFEQAAVPCWTEAAVDAAGRPDAASAQAACDKVRAGMWRDECHFRVGEALGLAGDIVGGAAACQLAGRFGSFCVLHLAWWARPFPIELSPADPGAVAAVAAQEALLEPLVPRLDKDEISMLRASVWFDLYLGSGSADPTAARRSGTPEARTAWAHELVRLRPAESVKQLLAVWSGAAQPPTGSTIQARCWHGFIEDPVTVSELNGIPTTALVHGGLRLVGETANEDLEIALIQARAFHDRSDPDELRAFVLDDRPRIQWTAARLLARLEGPSDHDVAAMLSSADRALRASAQAGLRTTVTEWSASDDCW